MQMHSGYPKDEKAEVETSEEEKSNSTVFNSRGTKTLLVGPPGSGKTTALVSFIEAGIDLFVIGTDPGFEESILDAMARKNLPLEKLHYQYIAPASAPWSALLDAA